MHRAFVDRMFTKLFCARFTSICEVTTLIDMEPCVLFARIGD